ncbi:MAG: hypothetical protein Q8876_03530 [Bacillota bacterium]|nr:hypothetical protein [Bacillota bacterium]
MKGKKIMMTFKGKPQNTFFGRLTNQSLIKIIETITFVIFLASIVFVSSFHEPWLDETQAWLIARSASIKDLLFLIPHYEVHPPFWSLLLLPFARSGMPVEFGLKFVSIALCAVSVWLIIFKSPFPFALRITIPFTYFFFYQYGVISRTYSMMMLGFVLSAMFYKTRNEHPFRFAISLALICASCIYGTVIAAGIALVWVGELIKKRILVGKFSKIITDYRIISLFALLVFGVFCIVVALPYSDTLNSSSPPVGGMKLNNLFERFLYAITALPADATFYKSYFNYDLLCFQQLSGFLYYSGVILGAAIMAIIVFFAKSRKKTALFLVPYLMFAVFSAYAYLMNHHIGIVTMFLLFWFWVVLDEKATLKDFLDYAGKFFKNPKLVQVLKHTVICLTGISIIISVYWTTVASYNDIKQTYGTGRTTAAFIKKYNLQNYKIMGEWTITDKYSDTNLIAFSSIAAYFDHNIIINLNNKSDGEPFRVHRFPTEAENNQNYKNWAAAGLPDVILGEPADFKKIYGSSFKKSEYIVADKETCSLIWKDEVMAL